MRTPFKFIQAANRSQTAGGAHGQRGKRSMRGFGLVEMMIALFISMMVVLAITSLFLAQRRSHATQDDISKMQEDARAVAQTLGHALRSAGYRDASNVNHVFTEPVLGGQDASGSPLVATDSFTVRFYGSSKPGQPDVPDGSVTDCTGEGVPGNGILVQKFFIQTDTNGTPWLYCQIGNSAAIPMFADVEDMQLLYGEDTDNDGSINRMRPASVVNMDNVKGVMLSFIMRTPKANQPVDGPVTLNHFGLEYAENNQAPADDPGSVFLAPEDKRMRRKFSFFIGVRNRLD